MQSHGFTTCPYCLFRGSLFYKQICLEDNSFISCSEGRASRDVFYFQDDITIGQY